MSGLLKRVLFFCIKSIDLVKVLIFRRVGFLKVRVGIIYDPLKHLRSDLLRIFSAVSGYMPFSL